MVLGERALGARLPCSNPFCVVDHMCRAIMIALLLAHLAHILHRTSVKVAVWLKVHTAQAASEQLNLYVSLFLCVHNCISPVIDDKASRMHVCMQLTHVPCRNGLSGFACCNAMRATAHIWEHDLQHTQHAMFDPPGPFEDLPCLRV